MKTCAERARNYRKKIQSDESLKQKERLKNAKRMKIYRQNLKEKLKNNTSLSKKLKADTRKRVEIYRKKIKQQEQPIISLDGAYKCKNTLYKALKKVELALPKDINKKKKIVEMLTEIYLKEEDKALTKFTVDEDIKLIHEFYNNDDISTETAGRKSTLISKSNNLPISKRFMVITVKEAYELFKTTFPEKIISRTKFHNNRPRHVELSSKLPHNMCVCQYHANFSFLLEALFLIFPNFPSNFGNFLKAVCCDEANEVCMTNECNKCIKDVTDGLIPLKDVNQLEHLTEWKHWRLVDKRILLSNTRGPITDLINELESQLPSFKLHCYVKRTQQKYFQERKKIVQKDEAILQIDFAENYRLVTQNEIQSAHFSYSQVTIFTCVAWLHSGTRSFAITSDQLAHNKYDVYCFLKLIVKELKQKHPISKLSIFSDGCASQFKNKFILSSIPYFKAEFDVIHFEWNFFATSHGKGAVDGIGAVVKRKIWQIVKAQNVILNNAHDFFKLAKMNINGIYISYVSSSYINNTTGFLSEVWANVKSIPGIKSNYHFSSFDENMIEMALTAGSKKQKINL